MSKIKVLYVISTLRRCGPVNLLINIIRNIDREQFQVEVLTLSPETAESREIDFLKLNVSVHKLNLSRINMALCGGKKFLQAIKQISPDILHSHGFRADYYCVNFGNHIPCCSTIHNYPHKDYAFLYGSFLGGILARKQINLIKRMQAPVACSKAIADELATMQVKTQYVRNGINISQFSRSHEVKSMVKVELGIPAEKAILVSVGTLSERKNVKFLVEGFLKSSYSEHFVLLLIGEGPLLAECQAISPQKVFAPGFIPDLNACLTVSDVYVSASKAEGLPSSVLEAMANGLPVLLSDIPPHREILELDASCGALFELDSQESLEKALSNVVKSDFVQSGNCSKMVVENYFSDVQMSKQYQNVYWRVIQEIM